MYGLFTTSIVTAIVHFVGIIDPTDPNGKVWHVKIIEEEIWRLRYHTGFPSGNNLKCSVFTQNKCGYGFAISNFFLPTLVVPFEIDIDEPMNRELIKRY